MSKNDLRKSQQRKKSTFEQYEHPIGHVIALNWAHFRRATTSPTPNKYPKTGGLSTVHIESHYHADHGELSELVIGKVCSRRDLFALEAHYVLEMDNVNGSQYMAARGHPCDRKRFSVYLEYARAKLEAVYKALWHDFDKAFKQFKEYKE